MVQTTLSGMVVVAIVVSLLKPFIEMRLPPGSPAHDAVIRLLAIVLGVVGYLIQQWIDDDLTRQTAWNAAGQGLLIGISAVVTYHLVSASWFDTSGTTSPPKPLGG